MDIKAKEKLHRQTIEAMEAWEKDKKIPIEYLNMNNDWYKFEIPRR